MAELNTSSGLRRKGRGVKKSKKLSTRVDLTPMVDLGFLLITFFIFTTTITRPNAVNLHLPKDVPIHQRQPEPVSAVITLLPAGHDLIYYYEGDDPTKMQAADFKSIRTIIIDKKRRTDTAWFEVVIKPTRESTYKNSVDILDEMLIDDVQHYALTEITPYEYQLIHSRQP